MCLSARNEEGRKSKRCRRRVHSGYRSMKRLRVQPPFQELKQQNAAYYSSVDTIHTVLYTIPIRTICRCAGMELFDAKNDCQLSVGFQHPGCCEL